MQKKDSDYRETEELVELQRVRLSRVYSDPVITHQRNLDWGLANDQRLLDDIIVARMKRLFTAPANRPINQATIPEAVAYLASASMDAGAATGSVPTLYHLTMREYVKEYDVEGPKWLAEKLESEEYYRARLDELRCEIKQAQDRAFLSNEFDNLGLKLLSRTFWTEDRRLPVSTRKP